MNVSIDGKVVGEIALAGTPKTACPYEGRHGTLPYGFFRAGSEEAEVIVCDEHCHTDDGYFAGLLAKVDLIAAPAAKPALILVDNGLLPCPFCGGNASIELAWRKTGRWIAFCEANCIGDVHTHYFDSDAEARAAWNTRAPITASVTAAPTKGVNMNAPQSVAPQFKTISVPALGEVWPGKGGRFAGIGIGPDGTNHLVFVHDAKHERMTWQEYIDWCKTLEADGHKDFRPMFRPDGALAYATMKDQFKDDRWYWLGNVRAGNADYAWIQGFGYGYQYDDPKGYRYLACAVRSEPI